jgi:hypothetical protein
MLPTFETEVVDRLASPDWHVSREEWWMRKHSIELHVTFYEDSKTAHLFAVQGTDDGHSDLLHEWLLPSWKLPSVVADWLAEQASERMGEASRSTNRSSR